MSHARFEAWSLDVEELTERRRRLLTSALMAAALSMAAGLSSIVADQLGVHRVDPPKHTYAVTLELLLEPPPPPSPPPQPNQSIAAKDDTASAEPEEVPSEPEPVPTEVIEIDLDARPKARPTVPTGTGGGGGPISGGIPGIPGIGGQCRMPPCIGTPIGRAVPVVPEPKPAADPEQAPLERVMATSIYTPDPDQARLARTPTGVGRRLPGSVTVAFCIDGSGKTSKVRVERRFPGDREVDEICRSTVAKWRFSPQRVGGKARTTCSSVTFDIRFD